MQAGEIASSASIEETMARLGWWLYPAAVSVFVSGQDTTQDHDFENWS